MTNKTPEEKAKDIIERTFGDSTDFILERVSVDDFQSVVNNYNFEHVNPLLTQYREALRELVDKTEYFCVCLLHQKGIIESATELNNVAEKAKQLLNNEP